VQVLSQCVTYRPEQRDWKDMVRYSEEGPSTDLAAAGERILADDGFTLGVFYVSNRPPYLPPTATDRGPGTDARAGI